MYFIIKIFGMASFFIELFVFQILFMLKQERRSYFPLRLLASAALASGFYFLPKNLGLICLPYIIITVYVFLCGVFCYKGTALISLFYTLAAFAAQHIVWNVYAIICYFTPTMLDWQYVIIYLAVYLLMYPLLYFLFIRKLPAYDVNNDKIIVIIVSALILLLTSISNDVVGFFGGWNALYRLYSSLCCLLVLFLLFGVFQRRQLAEKAIMLEKEKAILQQLLNQEKKQQEMATETIELINMKCHDIKHQISALRNMPKEERDSSIADIEKAVMVYGEIAKTGNYALDIILTEKGLLCEKHKIRFTYIVDGEKLSFMDTVDISSIFGNAIENAIQSVVHEKEDRRIIRLNISEKKGYLHIHCENYCSRPIEFKNGLPVTKNVNTSQHGFGVRSIKYIAEKYGGDIKVTNEDDMFNLDILIPTVEKIQ